MRFEKMSVALVLVSTIGFGCAKKQNELDDSSVSSLEATAEAAVQSISGAADEQAGSSFALQRSEERASVATAFDLFFPEAHAAGFCSRAVLQTCVSGQREISYDSCSVTSTSFTVDGDVSLSYSSSTCSMAGVGESVTRTYDYSVVGPRGATVRNFSASRANSLSGSNIGGGGKLTRTVGGWELEILGKHKVGTSRRGRTLFDVSVETASPVQITGSLDRASRVLDGGQVDVYHNVAGFKASFVPEDLHYVHSCCHPVSGSLTATYTGSVTGSSTLTFTGCGSATLAKDGTQTSVQLSYCE